MAVNQIIYDDSTIIASKMLEFSSARSQVLANNLANASTPGYIRKELEFHNSLAEQLESGDISNVTSAKASVVEDLSEAPRVDGNNITVATEMNQMMQNSALSNLLQRAYTTKMNIIRNSIKSGGA